jgi:hypothetical protein
MRIAADFREALFFVLARLKAFLEGWLKESECITN